MYLTNFKKVNIEYTFWSTNCESPKYGWVIINVGCLWSTLREYKVVETQLDGTRYRRGPLSIAGNMYQTIDHDLKSTDKL